MIHTGKKGQAHANHAFSNACTKLELLQFSDVNKSDCIEINGGRIEKHKRYDTGDREDYIIYVDKEERAFCLLALEYLLCIDLIFFNPLFSSCCYSIPTTYTWSLIPVFARLCLPEITTDMFSFALKLDFRVFELIQVSQGFIVACSGCSVLCWFGGVGASTHNRFQD